MWPKNTTFLSSKNPIENSISGPIIIPLWTISNAGVDERSYATSLALKDDSKHLKELGKTLFKLWLLRRFTTGVIQ